MVTLYITSTERGSGKTAVGAGLGRHLLNAGKKVGFIKPIIAQSQTEDSDAAFMKHIFALEEPADVLCPVFRDESNLKSGIKEALARVSRDKDVVIVEGASDLAQASVDIAATLNARVIIVEGFSLKVQPEGYAREWLKATDSYKIFGERLLGVVINKVPRSRLERVRGEMSAQLNKAGIGLLGVLPEDRVLLAPTVGEVTRLIQGEILSGAEKSTELVANIMLGAMQLDHGPEYYGRKANKAVVLKSERPDMQLAALQTPTSCLVISGEKALDANVISQAERKNVPIISAKGDIASIVGHLEEAIGKDRFNQEKKLPRLSEIMAQHFDFPAAYKGLGLAS